MQLSRIVEGKGSEAAAVSQEIKDSVARCVHETEGCINTLKVSLDKQMEDFATLVKYLKGLKPSTTVRSCFS
jgi:hypothetical protein